MHTANYPLFLNRIARLWRAGLSGFLLLNLALLHAAAAPVSASIATPAFSSEIQSPGHSLQRDLQRAQLAASSEIANGNNNDDSADTPLTVDSQTRPQQATAGVFVRQHVNANAGRYAYFLPEPRAAPQR